MGKTGAALLLFLAGFSTGALASTDVLVIRRATVLDGIVDAPRRNVTVVVRDGKIESIGAGDGPKGATVIDIAGRWLLPGLIDAHAHLFDLASARRALRQGVTTARVLGVNHYADVGIRELHRAGEAGVPDVLAGGYQITWPIWDSAYLDFPKLRTTFEGRGVAAVRAMVRGNAGRGVDVIKVLATQRAGLADQDPMQRRLDDAALTAAAEEARSAGLSVAAHAHSDEGVRAAALAGARTIEHGTETSDATLALMRDRGVCLVPTAASWAVNFDGVDDNPALAERARQLMPRSRDTVARAIRLGLRLAAGSDAAYTERGRMTIVDEVIFLGASGLTADAAVRAATSGAAMCLGIGERTGAVRRGLEADLIVVAEDPRTNMETLRQPLLVVNDGAVAVNRLAAQ